MKKETEQDNSSLDLALSSITEKQSALYLLARASLAPFLALTNMALHMIKQLEHDNPKQVAKENQDFSKKIPETDQQQEENKEINNAQFFNPINLNDVPEAGIQISFLHKEIPIISAEHGPAATNITNIFEIL